MQHRCRRQFHQEQKGVDLVCPNLLSQSSSKTLWSLSFCVVLTLSFAGAPSVDTLPLDTLGIYISFQVSH